MIMCSSGVLAARDGILTFMVGGKKEEFAAAEELLLNMGKKVWHTGPVGTGEVRTWCNIVWLSLMRVTDWLNTVTWLTNISVCCPPQSCGEGTLLDGARYHKMFPLLSRKQMAKWACDTIASNMYVDRPWPRAGCLLRAQYNKYALHCAQLKENPRWGKKILRENFYKFCRSRERQWGAIQYNRWRLCGEHHGMFPVSWGLKWYFGKNISPSISFQTPR